jgi:muconolactone delta-isomerase
VTDTFLANTTALLDRTPRVVRSLLDGLPEPWLGTPDTSDGWTPRDVVGHLISAELDDWIPRVEMILRDGTNRPFDPFDRFAHVERDVDVPLDELIGRFEQLRAEQLTRLRELVSEGDLDRVGRHSDLGEVTMRQLLATWAVHDLDHIAQIYAALAGSYDAAVGPWKAYLGILLRREASV